MVSKVTFLYVLFILIFSVWGLEGDKKEKRLLLNDPAVLHSQILDLEQKLRDVIAKNIDQERKIQELTNKYQSQNGSAVFVRWGREECPINDTELVYKGFAGGSWYDSPGGAAEFVCLPRDPVLTTRFGNSNQAQMYGVEYDTTDFGHANGDDVPCVVCRSTSASSALMIPAKNQCDAGWTKQYSGYLAAGGHGYKSATEYICLDEKPGMVMGGHRNDNGKLLYPVRAVCGSLTCPPYVDGHFLTCVVCTK